MSPRPIYLLLMAIHLRGDATPWSLTIDYFNITMPGSKHRLSSAVLARSTLTAHETSLPDVSSAIPIFVLRRMKKKGYIEGSKTTVDE